MEIHCWLLGKQKLKLKQKNHLKFQLLIVLMFICHKLVLQVGIPPEAASEKRNWVGMFHLGGNSRKYQDKSRNVNQEKKKNQRGAFGSKLLLWALGLSSTGNIRETVLEHTSVVSLKGQESWVTYPPIHLAIFGWGLLPGGYFPCTFYLLSMWAKHTLVAQESSWLIADAFIEGHQQVGKGEAVGKGQDINSTCLNSSAYNSLVVSHQSPTYSTSF